MEGHAQEAPRYFVLHKPWGVVSQFKPDRLNLNNALLGSVDYEFPPGTNAVGRLDKESEGLLLMTNDRRVTSLLFCGETPHKRTYLVKVKWKVTPEALQQLRQGVRMTVKGGAQWVSSPCEVEEVQEPTFLGEIAKEWEPCSWLHITLTEGKFHQVRKMCRQVGHFVRRLVRISIEDVHLGDLPSGGVRELPREEFYRLLRL